MSSNYSPRVSALLEQHRQNTTRGIAIMELIELNTPDANEALRILIQGMSLGQYYIYAIMALSQRNLINPVPYIRRLFDAQDDKLYTDNHLAGIVLLQDYPDDPDTMPLLTDALKRYHGEEFWQACIIQTLVHVDTDEAIYLIAQVMQQHEDIETQMVAAAELGSSSNPMSIQILLSYLEHSHPAEQEPVIGAALQALTAHIQQGLQNDMLLRVMPLCRQWLYAGYHEAQKALEQLGSQGAQRILDEWELWQIEQ